MSQFKSSLRPDTAAQCRPAAASLQLIFITSLRWQRAVEMSLEIFLALCPTCHALFHRGEIVRDSIYAWKSMLVSLSHAFDTATIDDLLFLATPEAVNLRVSGDGVLKFSRLVGAGLASFNLFMQNGPLILYAVGLTPKGAQLVNAWRSGNRQAVAQVLGQCLTARPRGTRARAARALHCER